MILAHFRWFLAGCEPVELLFAEVLAELDEPICHVYFPIERFISLTIATEGCANLEVGLIGHEGMLGISLNPGGGCFAAARLGTGQSPGTAHRCRGILPRTRTEPQAAAPTKALPLCGDEATCANSGLEAASCRCYEADKAVYARMMG